MADISLLVCTHNRADSLVKALESCCAFSVPENLDWELIVVANACSDNTNRVIDKYSLRLPLRVIEEPVPGLSRARNVGVRASRGELIVYADDDVEFEPHFLTAYGEGLRIYPQAEFFGGQVIPRYDGGRPSWLTEELEYGTLSAVCVGRRMGDKPIPYSSQTLPFGANFAVRRAILRKRSFREDLGVTGRKLRCHEETDLLRALLNEGKMGMYLPRAVVWHHTSFSRLRLLSILRQGFGYGRSDVDSGMVARPKADRWKYWLPNRHIFRLYLETAQFLFAGRFAGQTMFYKNAWCLARGWGHAHQWIIKG